MARTRNLTPTYFKHKQSGRGRLAWTDGNGNRHEQLLPGKYGSAESLRAKARLELELTVSLKRTLDSPDPLTVAELLGVYLDYAEQHYRHPDGTPTSQITVVKLTIKTFRELYADKPVSDFGPLCVKIARQKWIQEGRSRAECNRQVAILKRIFKWGLSEELVPAEIYQGVAAIAGLQRGRTKARETEPIKPVDDDVVDATLPNLGRHVRGLVELQRLCGCRPGEACSIRRCDIETGGTIWFYKPPKHKNSYRGKPRTIALGPKSQVLLGEFFTPNLDDYLFSPRRAVEELIAERSQKRKTPRWPSHLKRNADKRKNNRKLKERYTKGSYELAIDRACDRAFAAPEPLAQRQGETATAWQARLTDDQKAKLKEWKKAHRWSPNQLRHTHGTKVRKAFGLEAAGAALGHSKMSATEIYAERDAQLAATVALTLG